MKKVLGYFFSVFSVSIVFLGLASEDKNKGLIDLGRGEVSSDIQGAQYHQRIRGSFEERLKVLEHSLDDEAFSELEARHLKIALQLGILK